MHFLCPCYDAASLLSLPFPFWSRFRSLNENTFHLKQPIGSSIMLMAIYVASFVGMGIWTLFSSFPSTWVMGLPKPCRYWWENWHLVIRMHFVCNNVRTIPYLLLWLLQFWHWATFLLYLVSYNWNFFGLNYLSIYSIKQNVHTYCIYIDRHKYTVIHTYPFKLFR